MPGPLSLTSSSVSEYCSRAMPRDFFDPRPEQQNVVLIDAATLREVERLIEYEIACVDDDGRPGLP